VVKRLLNLFHREFSGVHQAAFLLAGAGILADILALLRDRLLASTFGAGRSLDIYFVSFRVPDFLYTATLLIAANTALIPILLKKFFVFKINNGSAILRIQLTRRNLSVLSMKELKAKPYLSILDLTLARIMVIK